MGTVTHDKRLRRDFHRDYVGTTDKRLHRDYC